jgi:hypothetical protein
MFRTTLDSRLRGNDEFEIVVTKHFVREIRGKKQV